MPIDLIQPDWPAPASVMACSSTRSGGVSEAPWDSLNLAMHVGDSPEAVSTNRAQLAAQLALPSEPLWLDQVHGTRVHVPGEDDVCADAAYTNLPGEVCVVMTADCLPVLLCSRDGSGVAAVHAGWRGLLDGVLERAIAQFAVAPAKLMAWLGPAIGAEAFEVGGEVREAFVAHDPEAATHFVAGRRGHWYGDLFGLARQRLGNAGVAGVHGGGLCTYSDPERFYSYRRDGRTGRMASLIWLQP